MKYKILRTDGDWDFHNNGTITELPEGAILLTDEEWENRFVSKIETEEQILQKSKTSLIRARKNYLSQTLQDALEDLLSKSEYFNKINREKVKREIKEIEKINNLSDLQKFDQIIE